MENSRRKATRDEVKGMIFDIYRYFLGFHFEQFSTFKGVILIMLLLFVKKIDAVVLKNILNNKTRYFLWCYIWPKSGIF